jgi:hypothetical protein
LRAVRRIECTVGATLFVQRSAELSVAVAAANAGFTAADPMAAISAMADAYDEYTLWHVFGLCGFPHMWMLST